MPRRKKPSGYYLDKFVDQSAFVEGRRNLFVAVVRDRTRPLVARLRALGFNADADRIEKKVKQAAVAGIRELTEDALRTARRHVPIATRDLQNKHIDFIYTVDEFGLPIGTVFVDGKDHQPEGGRRRRPERAAVLASYLNRPDRRLSRSRTNGIHARGSTTRNWISDARNDFRSRKDAIIKREISL